MSYEMSTFVAAINQVLTHDDIQNEISSKVTKVQLLLRVNSFHSLTLLLKFKWDIDVLKESFHASQDLSSFLVYNNVTPKPLSVTPIHQVCQLCFEMENVKGLTCRHVACDSCWRRYLKNKIESGNPSIECFDCSVLICSDKLETLLNSTELLTAYQEMVVNSYVKNVSHLTWCSKKCGNAVRRTDSNNLSCSCGAKFCFKCERDPHTPASCKHMELWEGACEDHIKMRKSANKKSLRWIRNNTQSCPKCSAPIQKNGGCIHMHCWKCQYDFCWNCRENWIYDGHNVCRFFRTRVTRPNQRKIAPYLLPFNYHKRRLGSTDESSSMLESRRVLMYSYVYAYHQGQGKISKEFKELQKKLKDNLDLKKSRENVEKYRKRKWNKEK